MNNIAKLSIGLVTTGAVATGAIFANSHINKKQKIDSESSSNNLEENEPPIPSKVFLQKRKKHRLATAKRVFIHYQSNEQAKKK